jgi:hypothetical protein
MRAQPSKPRKNPRNQGTKNIKTRHVLMALDDVFTTTILAKYLRQKGCQVVVAGSVPIDGLPRLVARRSLWHAVIADGGAVSGEILRILNSERPAKQSATIRVERKILLGDVPGARRDRSFRKLTKPVSPEALRAALGLPALSSVAR